MNVQAAIDAPKLAFCEEHQVVCTESGIAQTIVASLKEMGHVIDNDHIESYIGLNGKIGNAMGIKILRHTSGVTYDIGIDQRKDGWHGVKQ